MQKKWQKQMSLVPTEIDHPQAKELEAINQILKRRPTIYEIALQDLSKHYKSSKKSGARGMSAEQVIRAAIIKMLFGLTRCTWKGLHSFKSYVWSAIVSANLLTIARKQLA